MPDLKVQALNLQMLQGFRDAIQAGICTPLNTGISPLVLQHLSRLSDSQITLISSKFEIGLYVPLSPHDKVPAVFWEDLVFLCEEGNDAELGEMLDRLKDLIKVQ